MRFIFIVFGSLVFTVVYSQSSDVGFFLQKAQQRYNQKGKGQYWVDLKFKSSISEDTSMSQYLCIYSVTTKGTLYNVYYAPDDLSLLFDGKYYYQVFNNYKSYKQYPQSKSKTLSYKVFVEDMPFGKPKRFFDKLKKATLSKINPEIEIRKDSKVYYFDNENYSLKKITSALTTKRGLQYSEMVIREMDIANEYRIDSLLNPAVFLEGYKLLKPDEKISQPLISSQNIGDKFPRFQIMERNGKLLSDSSLIGKFYLLDFFYESCLPCLKAIPFLNELANKEKYPGLEVIGVDPILSDTTNMERFIEKNGIRYTVVIGTEAQKLWNLVRNNAYPTSILVGPQGIIELFENSFSKRFYVEVKKKISN